MVVRIMSAANITVSVDDLLDKAEELKEEGINFVKLTIVGDYYDSELSFEAYGEDGDSIKFGDIPASEYQD